MSAGFPLCYFSVLLSAPQPTRLELNPLKTVKMTVDIQKTRPTLPPLTIINVFISSHCRPLSLNVSSGLCQTFRFKIKTLFKLCNSPNSSTTCTRTKVKRQV
ncbi:hypothetical protein AMECASPLE_009807 [Ameca splendens]|uniref:Secreted protein n=1 Tax=Ameca splendens TaxID=208324 RepID=A0ABV0ZK27_9TELE